MYICRFVQPTPIFDWISSEEHRKIFVIKGFQFRYIYIYIYDSQTFSLISVWKYVFGEIMIFQWDFRMDMCF